MNNSGTNIQGNCIFPTAAETYVVEGKLYRTRYI